MPVPPGLVALSVTVKLPATVGVPLIKPAAVSIVSPPGKPVVLKLVGTFVAVILITKPLPYLHPVAEVGLVITGFGKVMVSGKLAVPGSWPYLSHFAHRKDS